MIKEINRDVFFLSQKCEDMMQEDSYMIQDLKDTYESKIEICVGMAANMIGYKKNMIIANTSKGIKIMLNPVIEKIYGNKYKTKEGCLSHDGERETERYEKIKVSYLDENFKKRIGTFSDFDAQIIQHEIDHCGGIII